MQTRVFVSHAQSDAEYARRLAQSLEAQSVRTWLSERDLGEGESIGEAVGRALRESGAVIFIISPHAAPEQWQRYEWSMAIESAWSDPQGKKLIPVLLGDAIAPPFLEHRRHFIRIQSPQGGWDDAARQVVEILKQDSASDEEIETDSAGASDRWIARLNELQQWTNTLRTKGSSF